MAENPLYGKADEMVDALFRPPPTTPTAAIRAAVLPYGTEDLVQPTLDAGLALVYLHDPNVDYLDLGNVPAFDFLAVGLPEHDDGRIEAFEFGMRFLRVHRPGGFVLVAERHPSETGEFLHLVQDKARRLGYSVSSVGLNSEDFGLPARNERNGHAFAVGLHKRDSFIWPSPEKAREPQDRSATPNPIDRAGDVPAATTRLPSPMPVPVVQDVFQHVADTLRY